MDGHLIYLISFITLIASATMAFVLLIIKSLTKITSEMVTENQWTEGIVNKDETRINVVDTVVKQNESTGHGLNSLKNVIDEISNNKTHKKQDHFLNFWNDNIFYLQTDLKIKKVLLLVTDNEQFKIERYSSFSFDALQQTDETLAKKNNSLKTLLNQGKIFYFSGKLAETKIFRCFFDELEQNKLGHLYIFPLSDNHSKGVLVLFRENQAGPLSQPQIQELIYRISLIKLSSTEAVN